MNLSAFKAYDIRGRIPDELNPELVYQVGRAYRRFREAETRVRGSRHPPHQRRSSPPS